MGYRFEYNKDGIILLDRYTTSSLIYQATSIENENKREEFINYIYDYVYNKLNLPIPDLVIFLHVPFELAKSLKEKKEKLVLVTIFMKEIWTL